MNFQDIQFFQFFEKEYTQNLRNILRIKRNIKIKIYHPFLILVQNHFEWWFEGEMETRNLTYRIHFTKWQDRFYWFHEVKVEKLVEGALIPRRWARYLDLSRESNTAEHVRPRVVVCTRLNYSKQYPPRNLVVTLRSASTYCGRKHGQIHRLLLFRNSWNGWKQFRVERVDFWQR